MVENPKRTNPDRSNRHKVFPEGEAIPAFILSMIRESMIETYPTLKSHESRLIDKIQFAPLNDIKEIEKRRIAQPSGTTLPFFELIDPGKTTAQRYSQVNEDFPFHKDPDSTTLYAASELLGQLGRKNEEARIQAVNYFVLFLTNTMLLKLPLEKEAPEYLRPIIADMARSRMQDMLTKKHIDPKKSKTPAQNMSRFLIHNPETRIVFRGTTIYFIEPGQTMSSPGIILGDNVQIDTIALLGNPVIKKAIEKICKAYPQVRKCLKPHTTITYDISKKAAQERYFAMGINEQSCAPEEDRKETFGEKSMQFVFQKYLESELPIHIIESIVKSKGLTLDSLRKENESPLDTLKQEYSSFLHSSDETTSVDESKLLYPE